MASATEQQSGLWLIVVLLATIGPLVSEAQMSNVPGARQAAQLAAAASDGMARYLAPDGPIQPGITAIAGLPMRAAELANRGISSVSGQLGRGARAATEVGGSDRLPGMQTLESAMPASFASMGDSIHGMIKQKNNFIRGQAERGVEAGNRLRQMMVRSVGDLQSRSSGSMGHLGQMVGQAHDSMMKSSSQLQDQLKSSLEGAMGRLASLHSLGDSMRDQASGIGRTVSSGLQGAVQQLQQTGEQVHNQLHSNHAKNTNQMGSMMGDMHDSLGNALGRAHGALSDTLRNVISAPMELAKSLSSGLMKSGGGSAKMGAMGGGGRGY